MAWTVEPDPLQPEAAIDWFRRRLPLPDPDFRQLAEEARRRAFWVAGLASLDLVQEAMEALEQALAQGETFEVFRQRLSQQVQQAWGTGSRHRLEIIFRTNLQLAYGAGRYRAADGLRKERPYWGLSVVLDGRTSQICRPVAGVVLPADDPFWKRNIPPRHFNCRTALITYDAEEGARRAWKKAPATSTEPGFGAPPDQNGWSPEPRDYHPGLWAAYLRALGQDKTTDERAAPLLRREISPEPGEWMYFAGRVAIAPFSQQVQRVPQPLQNLLGLRATVQQIKWAQHVLAEEQFVAISPERYLELIRLAATHPDPVLCLHSPQGKEGLPRLLLIVPAAEVIPEAEQGPGFLPWLLVVYNPVFASINTAYLFSNVSAITINSNVVWLKKRSDFP